MNSVATIAQEEIIIDGENYFERLISDIDSATTSILLESYIFNPDNIGKKIIAALANAAERGVKIKLMVDGFGSHPWLGFQLQSLIEKQVEIKIYHPLPWLFWQWRLSSSRTYFLDKLIHLFSVINRRNHRKTCVIDHTIAYIGSYNITADHVPHSDPRKDWRDTAVRIESSNVKEIETAFIHTWDRRLQHIRNKFEAANIFRINTNHRMRRFLNKNLISRIKTSQNRVFVTNAYFIPEPRLIRALIKAARRGTDVELIVPARSDVFFIPWASSVLYPHLLKAGVKIHEFESGILHAKTLVIDDWAIVGSTNLNSRSLLHDLEIDYVIQKPENVDNLIRQFAVDVSCSKTIDETELVKRSWVLRAIGRLVLYLRYWL